MKPEIGVWGPPGTGKTVFLAAALQALERISVKTESSLLSYSVRTPLAVDPDEDSASIKAAENFLQSIRAKLDAGEWPAPTTDGYNAPFSLYLTLKDNGMGTLGRFHKLRLVDAAGEHTRNENPSHHYWEHLQSVKVILFMIDAQNLEGRFFEDKSENYSTLIQRFVNRLNNTASSQYLAVVVTKLDQKYPNLDLSLDINTDNLLEGIYWTTRDPPPERTFTS
jgi:hypothetical protein